MQDAFKQVEEEFFRLRGQFAVGRLTAEEYDEALRHLQVRDAEGRVWMLGANSGRWYYTDSPQWVEGEPVHDPNAVAEQVVFSNRPSVLQEPADAPPPQPETPAQTDEPEEQESSGSARRLALVFFGIGIIFLFVAFGFFMLLAPNNNLFAGAAGEPTPTRIVPRIADNLPNSDAAPTLLARSNPNQSQSNATQAPIPVTVTPAPDDVTLSLDTPVPVTVTSGLVIEPTSTEPALTVIPTITPNTNRNPNATPNPNAGPNPNPTSNPDSNSDSEPDPNPVPPAPEQPGGLPPAVYITNIRVSPNPPRRNSEVTFTASFFNTNRDSVGMNWRIILRNPNRQGNNKDHGESHHAGITVPPGRTDFSITFVPVSGGGPCLPLQVQAARRRDDGSRDYLLATSGGFFTTSFNFC